MSNHTEFDRALIERFSCPGPRYTSYPTADRFYNNFSEVDTIKALSQRHIGALHKPISLYIHIPFCPSICYYCGCNKIITKDKSVADTYIQYIGKEIKLLTNIIGKKEPLTQLHLGGGSPTFLNNEQFTQLQSMLQEHFLFSQNGEYSIEVDPRNTSTNTIDHLGKLGFNRISIGVQDFTPQVQQAINRPQTFQETAEIIQAARMSSFQSVSIDLIYGLPYQNTKTFAQTLEQVISLEPDRIALYNYAHLPHLFKPQRRITENSLPSPHEKLDILQNTVQTLTETGYLFIGMDHFAKPSDELAIAQKQGRLYRNFQGYSTHGECDLIGLGVSSIGQIGANFMQNTKHLEEYYNRIDNHQLPVAKGFQLNKDDLLRRGIIQSIMCQFSVYFPIFEEIFLIRFRDYFVQEINKLKEYESLGLINIESEVLTVLPKGRFLVRNIAMVFDYYLNNTQTQATYSRTI